MNLGRKGNLMPTLQDPGLSTLDGVGLCPTIDLDFTQGKPYGHRIAVPAAPTAARASSALFFQNHFHQLETDGNYTTLYGNNVLRYGNNDNHSYAYEIQQRWIGLLIEGADQNVIVENTQYAAVNWTLAGGPTVTDDTLYKLYSGRSSKIVAVGAEAYMFQTALLTGEDYFICFLAAGTVLDDTALRIAAGVSGAIAGIASTHELIGTGMMLVWATFTATAANWDIGVNVRANQTMWVTLVTCCKVAPTNEGGAFPRSPIPSGAAATTRAADSWSVAIATGWDGGAGTFDVECIAPCAENETPGYLTLLLFHVDANNTIFLRIRTASTNTEFSVKSGGGSERPIRVGLGFSRGDNLKLRGVWNSQATLDGTNYVHLYFSINNAAWALAGVHAGALGGAFVGAPTLNIGGTTTIRHWAAPIRRVRFYPYPIVGAGW